MTSEKGHRCLWFVRERSEHRGRGSPCSNQEIIRGHGYIGDLPAQMWVSELHCTRNCPEFSERPLTVIEKVELIEKANAMRVIRISGDLRCASFLSMSAADEFWSSLADAVRRSGG